jgi:hypothetical protein
MTKCLQLIGGAPKMAEVTASATLSFYDEEVYISNPIGESGTGYSSDHLVITLPNSKTYTMGNKSLKVYINGKKLESDEYSETSTSTITLAEAVQQYARVSFLLTESV